MNRIEINSSNYKNYLGLDVVAFSLAHIGAMGEGGGVNIIESNGTLYHTNIKEVIKLEEAFLLCPALKDCRFNPIKTDVPEGWIPIYMGMGNFLVINNCICDKFRLQSKGLENFEIYQKWKDIVLSCLKHNNR